VFVFTGILPLARTDDELATVLGHEIAHNYCHHAAENVSRSLLIMAGVIVATIIMQGGFDLSRIFADLALNLPNSRTMESEADQVGLSLMAAACFNPKAAVPFWEKMGKADKANVPELMSTHPSDKTRVRNITGWMDEAVAKYDNAGCAETRYQGELFRKLAESD
jgi:Zn-dependent protease with chaperone function